MKRKDEEPLPIDELVRSPLKRKANKDASYVFDEDAVEDDYCESSWPDTWPVSGRKE